MIQIFQGDTREILRTLPAESVQCCVTSPPYWGLRDYGVDNQIGLEATPEAFVANMVALFREVKRVLRNDGTLWLNLGDSYNSQPGQRKPEDKIGTKQATNRGSNDTGSRFCPDLKPKDLVGIPWRVAFALQADGWYLRSDIIWHKSNPMPESVTDRPTKSHEYIFLLTKSERYFYDADAIREPAEFGRREWKDDHYKNGDIRIHHKGTTTGGDPSAGRNKRTVWTIATQPYKEAHFATFPEELAKLCILAGSKPGDLILDPFAGSGTTGKVAIELGRTAALIELNPAYIKLINERTNVTLGLRLVA